MTNDLFKSLAKIESALHLLNRGVLVRSLQQGLAPGAVQTKLKSIGLASTLELESLYGWRNGTESGGSASLDDIHLFPGFHLLSLEDAIVNYQSFVTDDRWEYGWLPVFANGGGDFYVVNGSLAGAGAVRHFRIEEAEHPIEFSSLSAMLATLAEGFDRGVFYVDRRGYLEMDDLVFDRLASELNPDVNFWRELN